MVRPFTCTYRYCDTQNSTHIYTHMHTYTHTHIHTHTHTYNHGEKAQKNKIGRWEIMYEDDPVSRNPKDISHKSMTTGYSVSMMLLWCGSFD